MLGAGEVMHIRPLIVAMVGRLLLRRAFWLVSLLIRVALLPFHLVFVCGIHQWLLAGAALLPGHFLAI